MKNIYQNAEISKIFEKDIPFVREIERACFGEKFHENFEKLITNDSYIYLLAKVNNEVVAYAGASIEYEQSDLLYVAVKSDFRRHKIASKLLLSLFEMVKNRGAEEMFLEVEEDNTSAINLYKGLGFVFLGTRKNYYGDKSAMVFVKKL